ncbi:MAG: DUF2917 domain-containing protein [Burkholderiaceae bacterium]|nr:DUF2917 domain-containing protein [Burkholderiaceae bacterium]
MRQDPAVFKTLDLPGGTLMPFASVPGERVRVVCGRVWLTEEGSLRDAFIAAGEEVSLDTRGLAVIETLSPARIQLLVSAGMSNTLRGAARRLTRWLLALWLRQYRRPVVARAACL